MFFTSVIVCGLTLPFISGAVNRMYHEFGTTKTAIVATLTVAGACACFATSAATIPNKPITEIVETIAKEN